MPIVLSESAFLNIIEAEVRSYLDEQPTAATQFASPGAAQRAPTQRLGKPRVGDKRAQLLRRNIDRHHRILLFYSRLLQSASQSALTPQVQDQFKQMRRVLNADNTPEFLKQFGLASDRDLLGLRVGFEAVERGMSSRTRQLMGVARRAALEIASRAEDKIEDLREGVYSLTESQIAYLDEQDDARVEAMLREIEALVSKLDVNRESLKASGPPESADVIENELGLVKDQLMSFANAVQQHMGMQPEQEPMQQMSEIFGKKTPQKQIRSLMKKASRYNRWALRAKQEGRRDDYLRLGRQADALSAEAEKMRKEAGIPMEEIMASKKRGDPTKQPVKTMRPRVGHPGYE